MRNNEKLELAKPDFRIKEEAVVPKTSELDYDRILFRELRDLRMELARKEKVPPFVVFGDKALIEMARYLPLSPDEFSRISGVGAAKRERFGAIFLEKIRAFADKRRIDPDSRPDRASEPVEFTSLRGRRHYAKTKELLDKKVPLERIAKHQDLKPGTIINHIEKLLDAGEKIDLDYLKLPRDRFDAIASAFGECGDAKLKPVFERLAEKYSYDELRLTRVLLRS